MSRALVPYLSVRDGAEAILFYAKAFGADELERYDYEGKLGHAALRVNGAALYLADEFPELEATTGNVAPPTVDGRTTFTLNLNVDDADAWFTRAVEAGCEVVRLLSDEFFGRHGKVRDPFGHVWSLVTMAEQPAAQE